MHLPSSAQPSCDVSVVAPAFNESANLPELVERTVAAVRPLGSFEIIIVDDGSTDDSWQVIQALAQAHPEVIGIRLQRNFGQHPAVSAGFAASSGAVVVTIDADLQNPPEEIPALVARLGPDCDVASGWRQQRQDGILRTLPSRIVNWSIARMTGVKLHDYGCMLRAYKRYVVEQLQACPEANKALTALTSWLGVRVVEVPIRHCPRSAGRSRYSFWRLVKMNFDILTGFSTSTLQVVSVAGFALSVLGFATGVFLAVWRVLHGSGPVGLVTFIAVLMFLAGMQTLAIGVVGEYVARIFTQVQGRPYVIVSERSDSGER